MARFDKAPTRMTRPVSTMGKTKAKVKKAKVGTFEGGTGYQLKDRTALYNSAVTSMLTQRFYDATDGVDAIAELAYKLSKKDPDWVAGFVPHLRNDMNIRSAAIVIAAEYVRSGAPNGRSVVASACERADEPGEMLSYWKSRYGSTPVPSRMKRGLGDACCRLYSEYSSLKYDTRSTSMRFADVLSICHPKPQTEDQAALFKWLIDRRFGNTEDLALLGKVRKDAHLQSLPVDQRRAKLDSVIDAGWTWERLSGWIPGGMDAQAWESIIPNMGYMALLRNLRNVETAGVSPELLNFIEAKLMDPEEVARSRQFPFRFYSAWKFSETMRFGMALQKGLELSVQNIPTLPGRTLVLVDTSGSMTHMGGAGFSRPRGSASGIRPVDKASVFAAAFAGKQGNNADIGIYGSTSSMVGSSEDNVSVIRMIDRMSQLIGSVGHGTDTWGAVSNLYDNHDRVMIFTDMQDHPGGHLSWLPDVPVYVWDLTGYGVSNLSPETGRYLFSGMSDVHFKLIPALERGEDQGWPWEQ